MQIADVTVKKKWDSRWIGFQCRHDKKGWRCGCCLRGLVKPRMGAKCKVCSAKVCEVLTHQRPKH